MAQTAALHIVSDELPAAPRRKPVKARKPAPARVKRPDALKVWATAGVAVMSGMSALLNGYANSLHAGAPWAGWLMGIAIPVIVLILGKVAGLVYQRGHARGAFALGAVGSGLLFLSVWHCSTSISLLTGSGVFLSMPMAVAIDMGLVGCEVAGLLA